MLNKHPFQCALHDETGMCGFTPVVIVTVVAMALGWVTGYLDVILFPGLAVLLTLTLYRLSSLR
ncbi:MAG: hypothetical protein HY581_08460 [Nitrospirae bacterium]|nr:hypothetical protein [Nitrospirota bacterium]